MPGVGVAGQGQRRFQGVLGAQADLVARRVGLFEGVHALVVPVEQHLLAMVFKVGHVDADFLALADPVQAADALLEQIRVQRQVQQHQVVGELEVTALGADLGTDQRLGAVLAVGEVGRRPVPLDQVHAFVEHRHAHAQFVAAVGVQVDGGVAARADHQHFRRDVP